MIIVGIDPGLTGAIAEYDITTQGCIVYDMPVMAHGKGKSKVRKQVNPSALCDLMTSIDSNTVFVERISSMPGQGVASMFSMGDTFGCIRAVCAVLGYTTEFITPQSWKKFYTLGSDKEVIRAKAIELFPHAPLSRKKDHNRAEACLIARYGAFKITGV